jgi:hypothetical protein
MDIMCPTESVTQIIYDDNKINRCKEIMSRLESLKSLSPTSSETKKQSWLEFISLWCEVLQLSPFDGQPCYDECARLIPLMIKKTNFYTIRKRINIARESLFACINQLDQPNIKAYLILAKEHREQPENHIYSKHVYNLLLIASQTASFLPFETIDDQQFINNHIELLTLLIERVDKNLAQHSSTTPLNDFTLEILNDRILRFFWNLTDRTVLIPILLKCHLAQRVVDWLFKASILTEKDRRPIISITHNIARHDDGADELNKYDAINAIKQYQNMSVHFYVSFNLYFSRYLEN